MPLSPKFFLLIMAFQASIIFMKLIKFLKSHPIITDSKSLSLKFLHLIMPFPVSKIYMTLIKFLKSQIDSMTLFTNFLLLIIAYKVWIIFMRSIKIRLFPLLFLIPLAFLVLQFILKIES